MLSLDDGAQRDTPPAQSGSSARVLPAMSGKTWGFIIPHLHEDRQGAAGGARLRPPTRTDTAGAPGRPRVALRRRQDTLDLAAVRLLA